MGRQEPEGLPRLKGSLRKLSTSKKRFAWRHRTKRKTYTRTPAEKASQKAERKNRQETYNAALAKAREVIHEQATLLHEEFGGHSIEWYFEEIMQRGRLNQKKRRVNKWNAFLRKELTRMNADLPDGTPRYRANDVVAEVSARWHALSSEQQEEETAGPMKDLEETREMKQLATHNVPINAFHDTRSTLASIEKEIQALHARTGTEMILFAVRSSVDHYNPPHVSMSSNRISDFFDLSLKQSAPDIAVKMEAYCVSGVEGVVNTYTQDSLQLKRQISNLVLEKLREVTKTKISRMFYQNFDDNITAKYGVIIKNWPLQKFCSPGDIGSRIELKLLHRSWQSGTTYFQKLSQEELSLWEENHFQDKLNEMQSVGDGPTDGLRSRAAASDNTSSSGTPDDFTRNGITDGNSVMGGFNPIGDGAAAAADDFGATGDGAADDFGTTGDGMGGGMTGGGSGDTIDGDYPPELRHDGRATSLDAIDPSLLTPEQRSVLAARRAVGTPAPAQACNPGASPPVQPRNPGASPPVQPRNPGTSPPVQPRNPGASPPVPCNPGTSPPVQPYNPALPAAQSHNPGASPLAQSASRELEQNRRRKGGVLADFVNTMSVTTPDGTAIPVAKKARKTRCDKGVPKPRKAKTGVIATAASPPL